MIKTDVSRSANFFSHLTCGELNDSSVTDTNSASGLSYLNSLEAPKVLRRKALTPRSDGAIKRLQSSTSDLEVIGDKSIKLTEMWPRPSLLKNKEFKMEMKLCGMSYKMNDNRELCGLVFHFYNG